MFFGAVCLDRKTLAELIKQLSPTLRVLINAAALRTMGKPLDKIIDTEPGQALKAFAEFAGRHNYHLLLLIFQQQLLAMGCNATPEEIDQEKIWINRGDPPLPCPQAL
ncbi:hypothetical protein CGL51_00980 [Pyrobaculum aerophilum]|uniref:Uncharacterized protein n=1 Tax=Pyrobaculum aerophilum TaxID=13773 RepID=A0A371R3A3_9CREN|nr:hypothetical protein CGL51_00980 [Pyrobaculum aerophilum]